MKCFRFIKLSWLPAVTISGENPIGKQAFLPFPLVFCFPILPHPNLPTTPRNHTHTQPFGGLVCPTDVCGITHGQAEVPLNAAEVCLTTVTGPRRKFKPRSWTHLGSTGRCSARWRRQAFALELPEMVLKWQRGLWNESSHWTMVPAHVIFNYHWSVCSAYCSQAEECEALCVCAFPGPPGDRGELSHLVWVENWSMEMRFHTQINAEGANCRAGKVTFKRKYVFIHLASVKLWWFSDLEWLLFQVRGPFWQHQ